jgi:hypothetical protein
MYTILGFCAFSEDPGGILCIFGSSSSDFVNFWKFLMEFCEYLEVPHVILSIFGSSSWDFVQFWMLRKRERMKWTRVCFAMRKFQKCTKSHEELPKMNKIIIIFMIWYDFSHIFYFNNFYCK